MLEFIVIPLLVIGSMLVQALFVGTFLVVIGYLLAPRHLGPIVREGANTLGRVLGSIRLWAGL